MEKLNFLKTWTIAQFKIEHNIEQIDIKKNEETGKCFFTYGFEFGACSNNLLESGKINNPVISQVYSTNTDKTFYLLHPKGEDKALLLITL